MGKNIEWPIEVEQTLLREFLKFDQALYRDFCWPNEASKQELTAVDMRVACVSTIRDKILCVSWIQKSDS